MSDSIRRRTIRLPLRKAFSMLPAFALVSSAILLSASAAPPANLRPGPESSGSPAVVVPDIAITLPTSGRNVIDVFPRGTLNPPLPSVAVPAPQVPVLPAGVEPGSSLPVTLDRTGIPVRALDAYRMAIPLVSAADPACHIDWALVAAIGRVESDHARFGGNHLDRAGVAQPGIIGIPLDGSHGTARITDTDRGVLDRDMTYDRAVGPMQFIPSTWRVAGADGNGDQSKDPQNMADAATATAIYLCSGPGDLRRPDDLRAAILRYNASDSYARMVTAIASAYRHGVTALPASDLAPAISPATSRGATKRARAASGRPASRRLPVIAAAPNSQEPGGAPPSRASIPPTSTPAPAPTQAQPTVPALPKPPAPTTTTPTPATPTPATPGPATPSPTDPATDPACVPAVPTPTSSALPTPAPSSPAAPTPAEPCLPIPCQPTPAASSVPAPTSALTSTPGPSPAPGSTATPSTALPIPCPTPTASVSASTASA